MIEYPIKRRYQVWLLVGASIIFSIWFFLLTRPYGLGVSADSVDYIAAARNIADGKGAIALTGNPMISHPPFYSVVLAIPDFLFSIDPMQSAPVINSLLLGLIILLSGYLLIENFHQKNSVLVFLIAAIIISKSVNFVALCTWSELLFIFFSLTYLIFVERYRKSGGYGVIVLMGLSVALASLTRYIGIMHILIGVISISFFNKISFSIKTRQIILFLFVSCLPIGLWLIRNWVIRGSFFGNREPSIFTLSQNIMFTLSIVLQWFLPKSIAHQIPVVMILLLIFGLTLWFWLRRDFSKGKQFVTKFWSLIVFVVIYIAFLIFSSTTTAYDRIGDRLLAPVYIPLIILGICLVWDIAMDFSDMKGFKFLKVLLPIAIFLTLIIPAKNTYHLLLNFTNQGGYIYNTTSWRESETIRYAQERQILIPGSVVYSNDPHPLFLYTNFYTYLTPSKTGYNSPVVLNSIDSLQGKWPKEGTHYMIWFSKGLGDFLHTLEDLQTIAQVEEVVTFQDGAIYLISRK